MAFVREVTTTTAERELTRAVRRVNERYGNDLDRFFKDAQKAESETSDSSQEDRSKGQVQTKR